MTVTALSLREFTAFGDISFEFSPGLNVIIGANATGKTHLMKLVYSLLKTAEGSNSNSIAADDLRLKVGEKLSGVFKPDRDRVGRLVKRAKGRKRAEVEMRCGRDVTALDITTLDKVVIKQWKVPPIKSCLFLPAREMLSIYPNLIPAYKNRELSLDETIFDLCVALSAAPLRGPRRSQADALLKPLEDAVLRRVVLRGDRFYLQSRGEGIDAPDNERIAHTSRRAVLG
jgi:energy-coupling factor transporter ATP-binding protein EcfA2